MNIKKSKKWCLKKKLIVSKKKINNEPPKNKAQKVKKEVNLNGKILT